MTLLNVHPTTGIVYSNMRHVAEQYPTAWDAERLNAQIFYDMERLALPLYAAIARLPGYLEDPAPLLEEAIGAIRAAFKLFADTVKEGKLKKDAWMSHAQGESLGLGSLRRMLIGLFRVPRMGRRWVRRCIG